MSQVPVAVVTGGSRGIGKAVADECMSLGFRVVLVARSARNLEQACRELSEKHAPDAAHQPDMVSVDVAGGAAVKAGAGELIRGEGAGEVLVNAGGIRISRTF